jgi:GNAT superfamily N-acetyltransferase
VNSQIEPNPIQVRLAQSSDIPFIVQSQIHMAWETENLKLDPPTVEKGVSAVFGPSVMGDYYIAEINGDRVACLLTLSEWSDWRNGNVIWIHSLYVLSEYRGAGVFQKMYDHLKELVQTSDYRGLRLYVDKTNLRAQKVYEKLGMTKEHYDLFEWMK